MTSGEKQKRKCDDKLKQNPNRRAMRWMIVLVMWIVFSGFWCLYTIALRKDGYGLTWYELNMSNISSYSGLLKIYSISPISQLLTLIIPFVSVGICIRISLFARRWWLVLITMLVLAPVGFLFALIASLTLHHGTALYHLDTIEKDEHVYHLTYHVIIRGDVRSYGSLLLLTCDDSGDVCTSRGIISFPNPSSGYRFLINENNQLQVVHDRIIYYTLEDE